VHAVVFSRDGNNIISGGVDGCMRVWDVPRQTCTLALNLRSGPLNSIATSRDGNIIATCTEATTGDQKGASIQVDSLSLVVTNCSPHPLFPSRYGLRTHFLALHHWQLKGLQSACALPETVLTWLVQATRWAMCASQLFPSTSTPLLPTRRSPLLYFLCSRIIWQLLFRYWTSYGCIPPSPIPPKQQGEQELRPSATCTML
jgi:hypothetical protein